MRYLWSDPEHCHLWSVLCMQIRIWIEWVCQASRKHSRTWMSFLPKKESKFFSLPVAGPRTTGSLPDFPFWSAPDHWDHIKGDGGRVSPWQLQTECLVRPIILRIFCHMLWSIFSCRTGGICHNSPGVFSAFCLVYPCAHFYGHFRDSLERFVFWCHSTDLKFLQSYWSLSFSFKLRFRVEFYDFRVSA
jgi:hypothetical protein